MFEVIYIVVLYAVIALIVGFPFWVLWIAAKDPYGMTGHPTSRKAREAIKRLGLDPDQEECECGRRKKETEDGDPTLY